MRRLPLALLLAAALPAAIVLPAAAETLSVPVDTARLLRLGRPAQTVYVANPAIADVTVEACQGCAHAIDQNLDYWAGNIGTYCAVGAEVIGRE